MDAITTMPSQDSNCPRHDESAASPTKMLESRYPTGPIFREIADLRLVGAVEEEFAHLSTARVALADYDLLQHDFPALSTENLLAQNAELSELEPEARQRAVQSIVDDWLIANAGFISRAQLEQHRVNSPIVVDGRVAGGVRPRGYGRAAVVSVSCAPRTSGVRHSGLLDLKGIGVGPGVVPMPMHNADGLFPLEDSLREYAMQRAVDMIFARELTSCWTVPTYAVLSLGFKVLGARQAIAGMHVRRAHRRAFATGPDDTVPHRVRLAIELALRKYGLTSSNRAVSIEIHERAGRISKSFGGQTYHNLTAGEIGLCLALKREADYMKIEATGVQVAGDLCCDPTGGMMVDFGTIAARQSFDHPLALDPQISLNLLWPNSPGFVQPAVGHSFTAETWSFGAIAKHCRTLAEQFQRGELSSNDLRRKLERPLIAMQDRWNRPTASSV